MRHVFNSSALIAVLMLCWFSQALAQAQGVSNLPPEPFVLRNLLVCGDFLSCPWQRGTATPVGGHIANVSTMTADYWDCIATGTGAASASIDVSQVTPAATVPGTTKAFQMERTSGNTQVAVLHCGQVLDTEYSVGLQGKTLCLSFQSLVASLVGGTGFSPAGALLGYNVFAGTGTAQGYGSMVAGTWTGQVTVLTGSIAETLLPQFQQQCAQALGTATEIGIDFFWSPLGTAGASDFVQLAEVQLEPITLQPGLPTGATAFEHHPLWLETLLARWRATVIPETNTVLQGVGCTVTGSNVQSCVFPVAMRAAPTATITAGGFQVIIDGAAGTAIVTPTTGTGTTQTCVVNLANTTTAAVHAVTLRGSGTTGLIVCSADLTWLEPTWLEPANDNIALAGDLAEVA